jgi:hypothetical protein
MRENIGIPEKVDAKFSILKQPFEDTSLNQLYVPLIPDNQQNIKFFCLFSMRIPLTSGMIPFFENFELSV